MNCLQDCFKCFVQGGNGGSVEEVNLQPDREMDDFKGTAETFVSENINGIWKDLCQNVGSGRGLVVDWGIKM